MTWIVFDEPDYIFGSGIRPGALLPITRIFITANPILQTHFPIQNTKTYPNDFDLSIDAVLPIAATTVTLYGQVASAAHYIKVLSTGFVSINIDSSVVTSTVLATKDSKQRRYGVKVVGDDFIFTEDGATIDTVTDAVAAAKSLIINVIAQSNGADFFDGTLSDPVLTDLTTPSNSVAWQLNLATGNTEQAVGGGNDLTYNGAPDSIRELFTFNQSDMPNGWDGNVERIPQPIDLNSSDWVAVASATILSNNEWSTPVGGSGMRGAGFGLTGLTLKLNVNVDVKDNFMAVKDSTTGQGVDPTIVNLSVGDGKVATVIYTATLDNLYFRTAGGSTANKMNSLSAKQFIEVA